MSTKKGIEFVSVNYIITLNKLRYVACIEMGDIVLTTRQGCYQLIKGKRIIKKANTIGECLDYHRNHL